MSNRGSEGTVEPRGRKDGPGSTSNEDELELDCIFRPRSVAVVGASNNPEKLGWFVVHNLLTYGFKGLVYPVNPRAGEVHSVKAYPSVKDIPGPVDLVVVVVPARFVEDIFRECAEKGVRGLIVITAGFREIGEEGAALERRLDDIAEGAGMRFVGPNCMGVIHAHPDYMMDTTFGTTQAIPGQIAFMSQSGAMCVAILNHAKSEMIGFSKFVSMGNKTNISGNDLLKDFGEDPNTDIILMYIENFGNPRNLTPLAKRISQRKPILVVKSGRTRAGSLAASSHTGAMAGVDAAAEALFKQCGMMRATSIEELFDYAVALCNQPLPNGPRVAVLTNAGGPGIMTADAIVGHGFEMAGFSEDTTEKLRSYLPTEASVRNPVDMIAGATPEMFRKCLKEIIRDENVDSIIVLNVPLVVKDEVESAKAIVEVGRFSRKPILACFLGKKENSPGVRYLTEHNIPTYRFPESAVRALRMQFNYGMWLEKDKGEVRKFEVQRKVAEAIIDEGLRKGQKWLPQQKVRDLLEAYGFRFTKSLLARDEEEAVKLSRRLKYPIVLKIESPDVIHKWDSGGVVLDLHNEEEVRRGYRKLVKDFEGREEIDIRGVRVERMIMEGKEVILGMSLDPVYGPLLMYGLGGIYVETFKDVSFRLIPLTDVDAREMIDETKGSRLLKGARGERASDLKTLREWLMRLAQLVTDIHEIAELDMNPVMVLPDGEGCVCVDARIRLRDRD